MIRTVLREPLLHFLVLGAALFALFNIAGNRNEPSDRRIYISSGKIDQIVTIFSRTWQRPPTARELDGLIEDEVRDEVLYREAVSMGLDKDDTIVRRRLRQKFEFVTEGAGEAPAPSDSDLQAWLDKNPDRFRNGPKTSFVQIFLNTSRRGDAVRDEAARLIAQLGDADGRADISEMGDATMLPRELPAATPEFIADVFGQAFAQQLGTLEIGRWSGPLPSSYGVHLVYVRERAGGKPRTLDEVRDVVSREWILDRHREQVESNYRKLRENYSIVIEQAGLQERGATKSGAAAGASRQ